MMKKTMKYLSMIALALVGAVMTGCSSSDDDLASEPQQPVKQDNIVTVTTTVGLSDNDATRALNIDYDTKTLTKTFAEGDQVALFYYNTGEQLVKAVSNVLTEGDITNDGKSAKLTFELLNPKNNSEIYYDYPASMCTDNGVDVVNHLSTQNGTLTDVASKDWAQYHGNMSGATLPTDVTLENQLAIVAFKIKDNAGTDVTSTITDMTIKAGSLTYTITRTAAEGPIYVIMQHINDLTDIVVTAVGGGKSYTKSYRYDNDKKGYEANNFYQHTLKMTGVSTVGEAVDLGLPSGTKWANMNVGATSVYDYGLLFAWGETTGYSSKEAEISDHEFSWNNYKFTSSYTQGDPKTIFEVTFNKYTGSDKSTLDPGDDAAHVNWGGTWRMPTQAEIEELIANTTYTSTTVADVSGYLFTSKNNSNTIFLPLAGHRYYDDVYDNKEKLTNQGMDGYFWSSTLSNSHPEHYTAANEGVFLSTATGGNGNRLELGSRRRCYGLSIRPVQP